jgi:putative nucleotidyltransferase with HDIG domain
MSEEVSSSPESPLEKVLKQVKDIAVLPQVVFKIMESTASTDASASELERSIQVDPGFSAKVLSMANSAYFALPKGVTSIRDAVAFLGFRTVRTIAMNAGVFDMFVGKNDKESLRRREWWRHSLDTAAAARYIATRVQGVNPEEAYAAGLLHLIGKTVLDRSNPEVYSMVMMAIEKGIADRLVETHFFGCNHVEVSMAVCNQWGLPIELSAATNYVSEAAGLDNDSLRACVAIGHVLAGLSAEFAVGVEGADLSVLFPAWALDTVDLRDSINDWVTQGTSIVAESQKAA